MDVEAATVIEVFPAEESELASLDFVVGDGSFRSRGARAWASDGAEEDEEHGGKGPATAEADFGGRRESQRPELSNNLEEIRPKSGWVGFIDFGDHAGDEGEDPGQPGLPRTAFAGARGTKQKKGRKRKERIKPESGGGGGREGQRPTAGPGPPAAPGVPAISLTEPTPPPSLSEDSDGDDDARGVRSNLDESGTPRKRGGRKRGTGVEALDKYHWDAPKRRKRSGVGNGNESGTGDEVTRNDRTNSVDGSRTTTHVLERNGEVLALEISLSSKAISTSSLRSIDSAVHRASGPCSCSPKHGGRLCKGTVLVSLCMAIAGALYFGSLSAGSPTAVVQIMEALNCSSLTDCEGRGEGEAVSALASHSTNETEEALSAVDICAMDHCLAPCSAAAAAVKRCDDGLCVKKLDCEDVNDDDGVAAAARFALLGILVFAICCLVGAVAVMTPCTKRLCSHCFLRNRGGGGAR